MKRRSVSMLLLLLCCIGMDAQQRSESEAIQIARVFFEKQGISPRLSMVPTQKVNALVRNKVASAKSITAKNTSLYVVNDEESNRFVIVSADERLKTVLGYSDNSCFDSSSMPNALLEFIDGYNRQYEYLLANESSIQQDTGVKSTSKAIEPIIKSQWGQGSPFNDQCPENLELGDGSLCASGCVATAMAQLMHHYKYPSNGTGSYSYHTKSQNIDQSMIFSNLNLDWENILDSYDNSSTEEQKAEVAKLMHACGISVSMDYGEESSAYSPNIPYALINYFKYNPNTLYRDRNYYKESEWDNFIMEELEANHPILYSGQGSGGHQFILDGSNADGMYHFNFGWNGLGDGYYELDALTPSFLGLISLGDFSYKQTMICQISPQNFGKHEDIFYSDIFTIGRSSVSIGSSTYFSLKPICYSSNSTYQESKVGTFNGEIGVGLFDANYNFLQSLYKMDVKNVGIAEGQNLLYKPISFDSSVFEANTKYTIIPYAKDNSSDTLTIIRTPYGKVAYYEANVNSGSVELTPKYEFVNEFIPNPIIVGNFKATAYNSSNNQEEWIVTVWQDTEVSNKYWISNFDPAVKKKGFVSENGWNKVFGYINIAGTEIEIPTDQYLGENIKLNNFSGNSTIALTLSYQNKTMCITDIWGATETKSVSDGDTAAEEVSCYKNTRFVYAVESEEEIVNAPIISVSSDGVLTITCNTDDAQIYYTIDGTTPSTSSTLYINTVTLTGNCVVKAVAAKGEKLSDVSQYNVSVFAVGKPIISANGNTISISCVTPNANIYYTLDETIPDATKERYNGAFDCSQSSVIKAIAFKDNYNDSEVTTYIHQAAIPDTPTDQHVFVTNLTAGQLSNIVASDKKMQISNLTISGEINGTDIIFIRDMIIDGKLTNLDIQNATIVSGGDVYYSTYTKDYITEDSIISGYMFYECKGLISLLLPADAKRINGHAIERCDNLKQIELPDACTDVEMFGIYNCKNLERVTISPSTKVIHWSNMNLCPNLKYIEVESGNENYASEDGILFSKDRTILLRYPVGKPNKTYSVPNSVKVIGQDAFSRSILENVDLPEGITTIEIGAFEYNNHLRGIVIPNSVTAMGMMAFANCANLSSISISDNLQKIEGLSFGYCVNLQSVNIPKSVKDINGTSFNGCSTLKEFTVSDDNLWFTANNGIIYTKDMKELVKCPMALYATTYQIPDGVEEISDYAFYKCTKIAEFYLPESIRTIGGSAFEECSMKDIRLPQTVSTIEMMAFESCDNLESFIIPESLEEIPMMLVAYNDNLSYLYIPANVHTVGLSAFSSCKSLNMINCRITNIDLVDFKESYEGNVEAFKNIPDTCTWRIPEGCSEKYEAQPWWISTWRIIEDNNSRIDNVNANNNTALIWKDGQLTLTANKDGIVRILKSNGIVLKTIYMKAGETYYVELNRGVYIVNNTKVFIQ